MVRTCSLDRVELFVVGLDDINHCGHDEDIPAAKSTSCHDENSMGIIPMIGNSWE
jgi:hypothetical protein